MKNKDEFSRVSAEELAVKENSLDPARRLILTRIAAGKAAEIQFDYEMALQKYESAMRWIIPFFKSCDSEEDRKWAEDEILNLRIFIEEMKIKLNRKDISEIYADGGVVAAGYADYGS